MKDWYRIDNMDAVDTPALVIYPDRVSENIRILKRFLPETNRLRPHVKTHKSGEISKLLIAGGISKFKCATIAEAEMLAQAGAADILLAYQPVGPKILRLLALVEKYPTSSFSCLIDNVETAKHLSRVFENSNRVIPVFIDLNIGMNRTGVVPEKALGLYLTCKHLQGIRIAGLHAYDGHLRAKELEQRIQDCNKSFSPVELLAAEIRTQHSGSFIVVAGGTPTFPIHAKRKEVECSPGTFVYWDLSYRQALAEQPYLFAALVLSRVISKPTNDTLCIDLGHKSIASENVLANRVHFLNAPELKAIAHSEEHMVLQTENNNSYQVGDVLYGVPFHICPTCALYDRASVVENHVIHKQWSLLARNRSITI